MKKFMMGAAAFCCMIISSVALTACGDDNNEDSEPVINPNAPKEAVMEVKFLESQDILDVCDATVACNGGTEETVTTPKWTKTIKTNELPTHFSVKAKLTKKAGKDWDPEKNYFAYLIPVSVTVYTLNAEGTKRTLVDNNNVNNSGHYKGNGAIDIAFEVFSNYSAEYTINKNGVLE